MKQRVVSPRDMRTRVDVQTLSSTLVELEIFDCSDTNQHGTHHEKKLDVNDRHDE